jgi:hypothetical protein
VHFEFSQGFVTNCDFVGFALPAIAVYGITSNPVIYNCHIADCETNAVVAREASTPTFHSLTIERISGSAFSFSQFSQASVIDCTMTQISNCPFFIDEGAQPTLDGNEIVEQILNAKLVAPPPDAMGSPPIPAKVILTLEALALLSAQKHHHDTVSCLSCVSEIATHALSPVDMRQHVTLAPSLRDAMFAT